MILIHPTIDERGVLSALRAATASTCFPGFIEGDGGVAFHEEDREDLVTGLCVMPQLGHDKETVRNLIHRILKADEPACLCCRAVQSGMEDAYDKCPDCGATDQVKGDEPG